MQGFNMGRYYAPDETNPPSFNKNSHPLGARAKKINKGILTIRFEMPFAIWCTTCKPESIIGQGVRFNAEKERVGNYYTTPIYQFRLKHTACGGEIVFRTDPRATEYVVESGARRRDYGPARTADEFGEGGNEILTPEERERRREDAFAALEGRKNEREQRHKDEDRVEQLRLLRDKDWGDPYARSSALRKNFRAGRKEREKQNLVREELQNKFGLGVDIVDEIEEDRRRAKLIEFGAEGEGERGALERAAAKPLFEEAQDKTAPIVIKGLTKAARKADQSKARLQQALAGNTRATMDPFLGVKKQRGSHVIAGLKRKRKSDDVDDGSEKNTDNDVDEPAAKRVALSAKEEKAEQTSASSTPNPRTLVGYDSD
ncbi:uncharacterized protein K452DRAFT_292853 [Aplosporella prunicola CBS 121167]|uniref:CWC16 protein n=1 Tax=Aplosporella prunicola CBS 121167 TaxID=1176127 RepID=A0A6A6AY34_9PEZI|nr:uncharacterized protein K452DRAFT_292853 [Aplosporella prunicola CBS 121167]KAF2135885.1 hypothetical protein K452DRAFT_292853 [Aplosporella prunicola CBS 121167]